MTAPVQLLNEGTRLVLYRMGNHLYLDHDRGGGYLGVLAMSGDHEALRWLAESAAAFHGIPLADEQVG